MAIQTQKPTTSPNDVSLLYHTHPITTWTPAASVSFSHFSNSPGPTSKSIYIPKSGYYSGVACVIVWSAQNDSGPHNTAVSAYVGGSHLGTGWASHFREGGKGQREKMYAQHILIPVAKAYLNQGSQAFWVSRSGVAHVIDISCVLISEGVENF